MRGIEAVLLVLITPSALASTGVADLAAMRVELARSEAASHSVVERAADAARARDAATGELDRLKRAVHEGDGGFFAERRVRALSASVRELVELAIAADQEARVAAAALQEQRRRFRSALFSAASERTEEGDRAARAGRTAEAADLYGDAGRLLAEASTAPLEASDPDPWKGFSAEIPEAGADPASIAAIHRENAERMSRILEELARELEAAESAGEAWERLARFRGVLERAGASAADPRPARDMLRMRMEEGRALRDQALSRARVLETRTEVVP